MTPLIRRYIKTSFVFLMAGLLLGTWIVVDEFVFESYPPRLVITTHAHLPRYRPELAEAVYWIMAAATAVRAGAELLVAFAGLTGIRWLIAAGGLGQLAGALLFALNMWWRVRMPPAAAPSAR